jgi:hypothetical protein
MTEKREASRLDESRCILKPPFNHQYVGNKHKRCSII